MLHNEVNSGGLLNPYAVFLPTVSASWGFGAVMGVVEASSKTSTQHLLVPM